MFGRREGTHNNILLAVPHKDHCLVIEMRALAIALLVAVMGKLAVVTGKPGIVTGKLAVVTGKIDFAKAGIAPG